MTCLISVMIGTAIGALLNSAVWVYAASRKRRRPRFNIGWPHQ